VLLPQPPLGRARRGEANTGLVAARRTAAGAPLGAAHRVAAVCPGGEGRHGRRHCSPWVELLRERPTLASQPLVRPMDELTGAGHRRLPAPNGQSSPGRPVSSVATKWKRRRTGEVEENPNMRDPHISEMRGGKGR
jgi:hypothetical protein